VLQHPTAAVVLDVGPIVLELEHNYLSTDGIIGQEHAQTMGIVSVFVVLVQRR
jgi:hypothetical protein